MDVDFVTVARLHELPALGGKEINVGGRKIALFRTEAGIFAMDGTCPHRGGALASGWVEDGKVFCPLHGWEFDLKTGACRESPEKPLACYETRVVGDEVRIKIVTR